MGNVDRIQAVVGLAGLFLGITACGMGAPSAPAIAESPSVPTETPTVISVPIPTTTYTPRPTLTASATPTDFTPAPDIQSGTETATATPVPTWTWTHTPTQSPTASATPVPPSSTPTGTWTPSLVVATSVPSPEEVRGTDQAIYRYHTLGPAQPDLSQPCPGCPRAPGYITGRVVDAGGNPLGGVRLVCYNDWHRYPVVGTKGSGEYDFPILQAEAIWTVVILDEADQPLSPEAAVQFNPLEACWYRLNWQRID